MARDDASIPLTLVSADCHAGPELATLGDHVDPRYRDEFAGYLARTEAYDAEVADIFAGRGEAAYTEMHRVFIERDSIDGLHDPALHLRDLEADGVVADVIFPQGVVPFADYPSQPGMLPPDRASGAGVAGVLVAFEGLARGLNDALPLFGAGF